MSKETRNQQPPHFPIFTAAEMCSGLVTLLTGVRVVEVGSLVPDKILGALIVATGLIALGHGFVELTTEKVPEVAEEPPQQPFSPGQQG